jgi:integrase
MASLHRDPRGKSPFWYCAFTDADDSRHFKSTKEVLRKKAQVVCDGWQRATELARRGLLTQVQALKVVSEIYERANQEPLNSADTTTFLREWIASKTLVTAKSTARRYGDVIEAFLAHLGGKAARNLSAVAPADIATFRDACINAGKANKTANMAVKTLRIAFNTARRRGMILSNPAEAVETLPENSVTRDVFTREQIQALLAAADVEWRGMILLGACHGLRIGDAAGLTWANLDMERRTIRYSPQKDRKTARRKELEVPMHKDVEEYVLSLPLHNNKPDAPLFPKLSRKKASGRNGLSETFVGLLKKAGVVRDPGSAMANAGVSKERRMKLAGHKSDVHDRYTHHELEALRSDVDKIPSLVKE